MKESDRSFTIAFVLPLIDVFDDQYVVLDLECASIELLTANVSDANVEILAAGRM